MSHLIAGVYEIEKEIGSGGAGVVYLGRHTRLHKEIVLKADQRKLSIGTEKLRQEVDLLKGLSHTYIPQVYDFIQEGDTVYTVMDYVEGESLDQLLKRRQPIAQKNVIRWACQLLEALSYLHSQKEHGILHGDIKPANIMLRKNGDICLIDFNIALALGEDGAVQVGFSRGYASPEHYGSKGAKVNPLLDTGTGGRQKVLLDVRSDIYSLGATLYHLISGQRPAEEAVQVVSLQGCCSPQVAAIIQKAMHPLKERRYQTAEEMLDAFLHLHTNDPRVVKNKKQFAVASAISVIVFFLAGACMFTGMKQMENYETALKLASYAQASLAQGDIEQAVLQAMQAMHTGTGIWRAPVPASARKALTDALGVYDLTDGYKSDAVIMLPAAPFDIRVSPKGTRYAVVYAYKAAVYNVKEKEPMQTFPIRQSAQADCLFLDEDTIVYAGANGVEAYDLAANQTIWTAKAATNLTLSGDGSVVAAADRASECVVLYRTADGKKIAEFTFEGKQISRGANDIYADRSDYIFALDETGACLAVSFADGSLSLFDTTDMENELIIYDKSDYEVFSGGFSGSMFAFAAQGGGDHFFAMLDLRQAEMIGTMESRNTILLKTDADAIYVADGNLLARFDAETLKEAELAFTGGNEIHAFDVDRKYGLSMIASDDHTVTFFDAGAHPGSTVSCEEISDFVTFADGYALYADREQPQIHLMRLEDHADTQIFSYDATRSHSEARVSADKKTLMLFDYTGFWVYNTQGKQIAQGSLPDPENVYDQQYRREGDVSYLEVTWYDGMVRCYGTDGRMMREEQHEAPDRKLEEQFFTDRYKIVSTLHEAPKVYDRQSGAYEKQLEQDAQLTYVTQLDEYIMTEYVCTDGGRYGILLDKQLQEIAKLPYLCDIYENMAVFDYENGSIRTCSIYSLEELLILGSAFL